MRTQLRASLANAEPAPAVHGAPTPGLRRIVLVLLAITVCLVVVAGFAAAYDQLVSPAKESQQQELRINALQQDGQTRLQAGDWLGAREAFEELLTLAPADPTAQAGIQLSQQYEALDQQYADAVAAHQRNDAETALLLLRQIEAQSPGYRDVQQRI